MMMMFVLFGSTAMGNEKIMNTPVDRAYEMAITSLHFLKECFIKNSVDSVPPE